MGGMSEQEHSQYVRGYIIWHIQITNPTLYYVGPFNSTEVCKSTEKCTIKIDGSVCTNKTLYYYFQGLTQSRATTLFHLTGCRDGIIYSARLEYSADWLSYLPGYFAQIPVIENSLFYHSLYLIALLGGRIGNHSSEQWNIFSYYWTRPFVIVYLQTPVSLSSQAFMPIQSHWFNPH